MLEPILELVAPYQDKIGLLVQDLKTGEKISVNPHRAFSAASTIKYPIMWVYYQQVALGKISPQDIHILRAEDKAGSDPYDSSVLRELHVGIPLTYEDCCKFMIVVSDDTGTNILLDLLGMELINRTLGEIGLTDTTVGRRMMDYEGLEAGRDNFISAADMAHLSMLLVKDQLLDRAYNQEMLSILCNQRHNDALPRFLPRTVRIGHKGGCIMKYGMDHDVGIVYQGAEPRLLVNVLTQWVENPRDLIGTVAKMAYDIALGN